MSKPLESPARPYILKGTQAQALGSVLIEPRIPRARHDEAATEGGLDVLNLREMHDSLRLDPEAAAAERIADRILAEAQAQRESLLSSASQEAEQQRQQMERELAAMQEAAELELAEQRTQLIDGIRRDIEQEICERYAAVLQQLEAAAQQLAQRQAQYLREIEQPAFQLVLAIARQLLGQELSRSPDYLAGLIAQALAQLQPQAAAQLALHPDTLDLLLGDELLAGVLEARGLRLAQLELKPSPALQPGQFELQAGMALLSFDLESKAAELIAELEQRAASGSALPADGESDSA